MWLVFLKKECKKNELWSVRLRKVKGQELVMKGLRGVKNKASYSVDFMFCSQSGLSSELCPLIVSVLPFYWVSIMSTVSPCCPLIALISKNFPEVLILSNYLKL